MLYALHQKSFNTGHSFGERARVSMHWSTGGIWSRVVSVTTMVREVPRIHLAALKFHQEGWT